MSSFIDEKKLESLLQEGKLEEARVLVREAFEKDLDPAQENQAYGQQLLDYVKVMNKIDEQYVAAQNENIAVLEKLAEYGNEVDDLENLANVRKNISDNK